MVDEEIGARLSLKDRRQFSDDANRAKRDVDEIGNAASRVDRKARNMSGGLGIGSKAIGGLKTAAKTGAIGLGILAGGLGVLGAKMIGAASDAGETQAKFDTVFKGMEKQVQSFVDTTQQKFGIPTKDLEDAASTFGVFGKAAGVPTKELASFSTGLTQAGLDLSSFYNTAPEDAFLALRSGLAGEAEPLRKYGIFLSDAAMKAEAMRMGLGKGAADTKAIANAQLKARIAQTKYNQAVAKHGKGSLAAASATLALRNAQAGLEKATAGGTVELNEAQKVAVRQSIILKSLGDAAGDLDRTADSAANQWRGFKGRLKEAGTTIGTALLPMANDLVVALNKKLGPATKWLKDNLPGAIASAGRVAGRAKAEVVGWIDAYRADGFSGFTAALDDSVGASGYLADALDTLASIGGNLWTIFQNQIIPAFHTAEPVLLAVAGIAGGALLTAFHGVDAVVGFLADHTNVLRAIVAYLVIGYAPLIATLLVYKGAMLAINIASKAGLVVGFAMRGALVLWTAAQWALNVALSMNPIGLVVIAIVALVAIFILAWKHSETFRDIITGALSAVWGAMQTGWQWVKDHWPLLLGILTGPIGAAVALVVTHFDQIKEAARTAINWIIRAWNGLEFKIPGFDPPGPGPKFGGMTIGTPKIPELHQGGTTTTGGAVNMKPGEEIVILPPAASVVPLQSGRIPQGTFGGKKLIQVVLPNGKVLAELVYDETRDRVARA